MTLVAAVSGPGKSLKFLRTSRFLPEPVRFRSQKTLHGGFSALFLSAGPRIDPSIQQVAIVPFAPGDHHGREAELLEDGSGYAEVGRRLGGRE